MNRKWEPQIGEEVYPCYDGKWGRAVHGIVVAVDEDKIQVRMDQWAGDEKNLTPWFKRESEYHFGGFVDIQDSLMRKMFGLKGDWYSILPKKLLDEYWGEGEVVKP